MREREQMRVQCEKNGLHWAKGVLPNFGGHPGIIHLVEWISERESEIAAAQEEKQYALAIRNTAAAEISAAASAASAKSSSAASRAAIFAALVSFLALIVAIAAYLKNP